MLARSLGFWQLSFYGVGTIVGAGIYSVLGAAAGEAGSALWLSFLLAGVAALLAALSYAELASAFPKAGAEYQYLRAAFPRWRLAAFLAGALIALNAAASAATVSLAFGGYLKVFADVAPAASAVALLLACTALNIVGIRQSTWVGIGLITVEVGGLLLMIGAGLGAGEPSRALAAPAAGTAPFGAAALLFFMFIGFEDVANLSEEARQPRRDIPRALLLSVVLTSALYLLVCVAVLAVAPPEALARSDSPLTEAGGRVSPRIGQALAVTALFATASTALITLISISRLLYGMAREGDMPRALSRLAPGRRTPWLAALALCAAALALLPLGEVKLTASVSSLGVLCVFAGIHAAVIWLRLRQPRYRPRFRAPGAVRGVPLTAVAGLLMALAFCTRFEPVVYAVFGVALAAGAVVYALLPR